MMKRCQHCKRILDAPSFNQSGKEPDGLAQVCSACVNKRRRARYAAQSREADQGKHLHLYELVKRGDYAAVQSQRSLIDAGNRQHLLAHAVRDFKSAPKRPGHLALVKFLLELGAKPDFHLVCAATVGPHVNIMTALIEAGAEQNIFTASAMGEVDRVRHWLASDRGLAYQASAEQGMTPLHYACRSELGKLNDAYKEQLFLCASLLLGQRPTNVAKFTSAVSLHAQGSPLDMCAWRGGNIKIARLLIEHGWRPTTATVLAALGHFQRHGRGNYDVAALCLESGVDINEVDGRSLLHAFAHQGDIVGTRWLVDHGAEIDVRDDGNNTPLHKACERNSTTSVVRFLVERGASLTATNNNGETALDVAVRNDKMSIVAYLSGVIATPAVAPGAVHLGTC
jgi:ankyrin repeat protein